MEEKQPSKTESKRERQPISIPFIWEEKPGTPKKDWTPCSPPIKPATPPVKLVVSVPFGWEEKPGTPLPSFYQPDPERPILPQGTYAIPLSSPPGHSKTYHDHPDDGPVKLVVSVPFGWEEKPGMPLPSFYHPESETPISPPGAHNIALSSPPGYTKLYHGGPDDEPVKLVVSVPFEWEEKPGTPLPSLSQPEPETPISPPGTHTIPLSWPPEYTKHYHGHPDDEPVKLIVSVPFEWEEKPGTPLPTFYQPGPETPISPLGTHTIALSSPPGYTKYYHGRPNDGNIRVHGERDALSDSDLETCSFHTNDSFSSAPSLLSNGLISTTAVPLEQSSIAMNTISSPDSPPSDTDSTTSSYATGSTSLAGDSFLQWLFPLLVPNSNFRDKIGYLETNRSEAKGEELLHQGNRSRAGRPLLTLGELIVMSRRRSCQRKIKMHKQPSMEFMKRNGFGCGIFGNVNGLSEPHRKWKRQLQLKLM